MKSSGRRLNTMWKVMHGSNGAGLQSIHSNYSSRSSLIYRTAVELDIEKSSEHKDDHASTEQSHNAAAKARDVKSDVERRKWWKPDPLTGVWGPDQKAHIDAAYMREKAQIKEEQVISTLCERVWWSSLEEIPERHR